jgi:chromosome segregation ATPase
MTEHDRQADELERELDDMERQADRLEDEISEARTDWERKQGDSSIPGAVDEREAEGPEPAPGESRGDDEPPPEQQYPAKGD